MSSQLIAAAAAGGVALLASPYLASLTVTAPDRSVTAWWQPRTYSRSRYAVTAAAAVVLAALAGAAAGLGAAWPAYLALALTGAPLAVVDAEHHRLPNRLMYVAGIAGVALLALAAVIEHRWDRFGRVALAAAVVFALFYLLALASPRSIGLGDVKLAALLAGYLAWYGWLTVFAGLAGGFLAAGIAALILLALGRADRSSHIPMGPFLIAAAVLATAVTS